jgi:2-oxoglutarate ferredoxin oxidoreductase subunit alpha
MTAATLVNDFSIQVATVNGSGSQTANSVLMRSIFQMGVPVSGKNLFPSNIQGLPTWFTIRANAHGYTARKAAVDLLICMNPETAVEDVKTVRAGAAVIYDEPLGLNKLRDDLTFLPVPFGKIVAACCPDAKLRKLITNMIYVGVSAQLLHIDFAEVDKAIAKQLNGKVKAITLNQDAIKAGAKFAQENFTAFTALKVEPMNKTQGWIIVDGNAAAAIGSMFSGVTFLAWYPITPSSSLCESLIDYLHEYRKDPATGKSTYAIVQAEDEIAAAGMVLGAGWAGARSMTSTSGPGISLMSEFIGLGYYAEVPGVFWNVQRTGPSTGLPTRTMQGDLLSTYYLSHGDTKHICLIPGSVEECFEMAHDALELSEKFQTPVFVLSDLDLGMNNWMSPAFKYPERPITRGKVLTAEEVNKLGGFQRYADVDGDGIPYRTLPGGASPLATYFTRGSGHNAKAGYSERPDDYKNNVDRLTRKFETARKFVPKPVLLKGDGAKEGLIAFGTSHDGVIEARDRMKAELGKSYNYLRLRALPFTAEVDEFINQHEIIWVVEQNRDGQLAMILRTEYPQFATRFRSVLHYDGLPLDAQSVIDLIHGKAASKTAASAA